MPARAVWRPPEYVWILLGLAALALTPEIAPSRLEGHWLFITPLLIAVGVMIVRRLWELPPAVTMCAAIVLTIFSGAWSQIGLGGLPFDRLLIVIVLLQFLLRAPGVAHTPFPRLRNVHLVMGLAIIYVLASAAIAGTLTSETGLLSLIDQFGIIPFLMFVFAPAIFSGRRERDMLLGTLVGLGAYLGFTAIFESLGPHFLVFPKYILNINSESINERAGGPFQSSVAEGFATFGCAVAATIAFAKWHESRKRYLAAIVVVVCIIACFLTLERGVWIAVVVAPLVAAMTFRTGRRWLTPAVLISTIVIGGALAISPALAGKTSQRANDQSTVWDRQNQTSAGLRMLVVKPLFGFGWDRYTSDSLEYFRQPKNYPMVGYSTHERPLPIHNTYLSYAVELGLVGALLWLISLLWGMGEAICSQGQADSDLRSWKLGLVALTVFFLVIGIFNPYEAPFPVLLLWVWAGVAFGSEPLSAQVRRAKMIQQRKLSVVGSPQNAGFSF